MNEEMKRALRYFKRGAEQTPTNPANRLNLLIGDACDHLMQELKDIGLNADGSDLAMNLEAAIYAYVKASNPGNLLFPFTEGHGKVLEGDAHEKVIDKEIVNSRTDPGIGFDMS